MKISSRPFCLALVLLGFFLPPCNAQQYSFTLLGGIPGYEDNEVSVTAINASGQIIGKILDLDTDDALAFVYSGGVYTVLSPLGPEDRNTEAYSINDAGVVTFTSSRYWGGDPSAVYTYANGVFTDLKIAATEGPILINNAGQIAYTQYSPGTNGFAYLRTGDTAQSLGTVPGANGSRAIALNNLGQVAGGANNNHAILWNGSAMVDLGTLPFAASSSAQAVNDAGTVVGSSGYQPFIFKDGVMSVLFEVLDGSAVAYGINNHGAVVGSTYHNDDTGTAWLYENGVLTDLSTLLPLSINGAPGFLELYYATDINDAGQIIGAGEWIDESGDARMRGFLLTPVAVPEPATCALLLVTMVALGSTRMRRGVAGGFAALFCGFGALSATIDTQWTDAVASGYFLP